MITFLALCCAIRSSSDPIVTPYFRKEALAIKSIVPVLPTVARFGVEELNINLGATYDNPFDPSDVSLDAEVTPPKGAAYSLPGFFSRPFERSLVNGKEKLTPTGDGEWKLRICPTEAGTYRVIVKLRDRSGVTQSSPFEFKTTDSTSHGLVRLSPRNHEYFEYSDGTAYFPIGANVCWGNDKGTYSYDDWIPAYGKVGANYMRFWLGPSWVTFAMEVSGKTEEGQGFGQFELPNAWRLDRELTQAQANGLNVMLTIDSYNTLRAHDAYPAWDHAPANKDNGGPIRIWTDFWTNASVDQVYRSKLRYLVARYSAYSNLMSWEFWNEVDLTEDYSPEVVQAWHRRMGDELRAIDPYHHLVTTSLSDSMGNRNLDLLPELDYDQTHSYNNPDVAGGVLVQQSRKSEWGKAHYVGEIGADASGPRASEDPAGIQIHDPLWMSVATGSSGTAMPWWWDNLIAPNNLYGLFGAVANFTKGIDWPGEDFKRTNIEIGYQTPPKIAVRKDLALENGPVQWSDGESNKPHFVTIQGEKADGDLPLPGIQHGVRNHRDWHNPVRFKVNLAKDTRFETIVGDVSGYGGAVLQISIDGDPVMTREFKTAENGTQGASSSKFSGNYGITVPKGEHTVLVENIGNDWFMAGYRFVDLVKRVAPPIQGWAVEGNSSALVWLRAEGRTWRNVVVNKVKTPTTPPSFVTLVGLAAGDWKSEVWDTWKGTALSSHMIHVGLNGRARVDVRSFDKDLALKLTRIDSQRR